MLPCVSLSVKLGAILFNSGAMEAFSTLVIAGGSVGTNSVGINSDVGYC